MIRQEHVGKRGGGRSGNITHDRHFFLTRDMKMRSFPKVIIDFSLHPAYSEFTGRLPDKEMYLIEMHSA